MKAFVQHLWSVFSALPHISGSQNIVCGEPKI